MSITLYFSFSRLMQMFGIALSKPLRATQTSFLAGALTTPPPSQLSAWRVVSFQVLRGTWAKFSSAGVSALSPKADP